MSEDEFFDGKVRIRNTVEYYEEIDIFEYDLRTAAALMSEDERKKVMAYINRLTKNRLPLYSNKSNKKYKPKRFVGRKVFYG
jgi:hypothetical protein